MKTLIITLAGLALTGAALAAVDPTQPMVTGRGNVTAKPASLIVTNQTTTTTTTTTTAPAKADETVSLEKFQVTGSLLPHVEPSTAPKK